MALALLLLLPANAQADGAVALRAVDDAASESPVPVSADLQPAAAEPVEPTAVPAAPVAAPAAPVAAGSAGAVPPAPDATAPVPVDSPTGPATPVPTASAPTPAEPVSSAANVKPDLSAAPTVPTADPPALRIAQVEAGADAVTEGLERRLGAAVEGAFAAIAETQALGHVPAGGKAAVAPVFAAPVLTGPDMGPINKAARPVEASSPRFALRGAVTASAGQASQSTATGVSASPVQPASEATEHGVDEGITAQLARSAAGGSASLIVTAIAALVAFRLRRAIGPSARLELPAAAPPRVTFVALLERPG